MSYTQADLDALKAAVAQAGNAQRVTYSDGAGLTYMSIKDAVALMSVMQGDIRSAVPAPVRPVRAFLAQVRSGY